MSAFQAVTGFELQGVEGGGALVVAAAAGALLGITGAVGVIAYKSANDFVNATQQQQGSGSGGSK